MLSISFSAQSWEIKYTNFQSFLSKLNYLLNIEKKIIYIINDRLEKV